MTTLRDLDADGERIRALIEADDDPDESLTAGLDALNIERHAKIKNLAMITLEMDGELEAIKAEQKRLQELRRYKERYVKWARGYMLDSMRKADEKVVRDALIHVHRRKNPPSVQIIDEKDIPTQYARKVTKIEPDKARILKALRLGENVPGARLADDNERVEIK